MKILCFRLFGNFSSYSRKRGQAALTERRSPASVSQTWWSREGVGFGFWCLLRVFFFVRLFLVFGFVFLTKILVPA